MAQGRPSLGLLQGEAVCGAACDIGRVLGHRASLSQAGGRRYGAVMTDTAPITEDFARKAQASLLGWYDAHARDLPWRVGPAQRRAGVRPDPYRVWLSEIMLQQTTVPHATPYFARFTALWPTVEALAAAPADAVLKEWAGLGYYARARNLIACARAVAAAGGFPDDETGLRGLPGVGAYTAAAIAAIAFDAQTCPVDGNVERVLSRLFGLEGDWPAVKKEIGARARALAPADRPGDFAQALMDLGATLCTPKRPDCLICPWSDFCRARAEGSPERYPIKPEKTKKPVRSGIAWWLEDAGEVLLVRRPPTGLLGGMLALPSSEWREGGVDPDAGAPVCAGWTEAGEVRHVFTHFSLRLSVRRAVLTGARPEGIWTPVRAADEGLPTVFAKAARMARASR